MATHTAEMTKSCRSRLALTLSLLMVMAIAASACSDDSDAPVKDAAVTPDQYNPAGPGCPISAHTGEACTGNLTCNYNIANPPYYCMCKNSKWQCQHVHDMSGPDKSSSKDAGS